jgi:hypothetical protein
MNAVGTAFILTIPISLSSESLGITAQFNKIRLPFPELIQGKIELII